jgi:uncharacterized protein (TIGR02996 family)
MTTEDDFQAALDANPDDWQARLVFADWLQERGDPRAEGYRALGALRRAPYPERVRDPGPDRWGYHGGAGRVLWDAARGVRLPDPVPAPAWAALPAHWLKALQRLQRGRNADAGNRWWSGQALSRRAAEDAAALAFARLPAKRRAELLRGPLPAAEAPEARRTRRPRRA